MDLIQREGNYPVPPGASKILGVEFSGTIEELGADGGGREEFQVGDEVFGLAYGGAYAEYISVSTHMLVRKPKELGWEECAGIPEVRLPLATIHSIDLKSNGMSYADMCC
jgi:NADPH:quinone reductase-like Zn-dependent oxidoreductase